MTDKRYILKKTNTVSTNYPTGERVYDTILKKELYNSEIVNLLNNLIEEKVKAKGLEWLKMEGEMK